MSWIAIVPRFRCTDEREKHDKALAHKNRYRHKQLRADDMGKNTARWR